MSCIRGKNYPGGAQGLIGDRDIEIMFKPNGYLNIVMDMIPGIDLFGQKRNMILAREED